MKNLVTTLTAMILVACGAQQNEDTSRNSSSAASASSSQSQTSTSNTSTVAGNSSNGSSTTQTVVGNNSGSTTSTAPQGNVMYLAENVILDTTTKVLASQIMLTADTDKKVGRLKSANLELALANEVAPSLATSIANRAWVATNKTSSSGFTGNGHVTFTDNEIVLLDGRFAAGGMNDSGCSGLYADMKYSYELIGNNHMILTTEWKEMMFGNLSAPQTRQTILKFSVEDQNTMIVVGHGICGGNDDGITVLTAVAVEE